jgi:hypothetical protein
MVCHPSNRDHVATQADALLLDAPVHAPPDFRHQERMPVPCRPDKVQVQLRPRSTHECYRAEDKRHPAPRAPARVQSAKADFAQLLPRLQSPVFPYRRAGRAAITVSAGPPQDEQTATDPSSHLWHAWQSVIIRPSSSVPAGRRNASPSASATRSDGPV